LSGGFGIGEIDLTNMRGRKVVVKVVKNGGRGLFPRQFLLLVYKVNSSAYFFP
jgi:hypothetical protein